MDGLCSDNQNTPALARSRSIKFLKKTMSFSDNNSVDVVPKGFVAVCVGTELKRFVNPTEYLTHQAFGLLLREAEEEFGFQQEGVLKIPCQLSVFEMILKVVEDKREEHTNPNAIRCSPDSDHIFHSSSTLQMSH